MTWTRYRHGPGTALAFPAFFFTTATPSTTVTIRLRCFPHAQPSTSQYWNPNDKKTKNKNKVMGLSTFHLVEIRTQYIDIWLLVTCLRTLTSLVLYQQPPCVCGSGPFYSVKPAQFHHSFTHHTISFSSNGVSPRKKNPNTPKKSWKQPETPYLLSPISNHSLFFATHAPYIFSFIFFSQTLSSRSSPGSPTCDNTPFPQCPPGDATRLDNGRLSNYPSHMETTPCLYVDPRQST